MARPIATRRQKNISRLLREKGQRRRDQLASSKNKSLLPRRHPVRRG